MLAGEIGLTKNIPVLVVEIETRFYDYIANNLSPLYLKRTKQALSFILQHLKAKFINNITEEKIERYKEIRKKEVSVSTVNIELNALKVMLNRAVKHKWILRGLILEITLIKTKK